MRSQLPAAGEVFLDHVAWFVADMAAAEAALAALGFRLTPFTRQSNQTPTGPVSAGMANRCAMLEAGYLEFLTAVEDTALARQFHLQLERYHGLHLLAFAVADAEAAALRLRRAGFEAQPPVQLRRTVEAADGGSAEAAFTVVRVPPEAMPEGRIQMLTHHTPEAIWQSRWTAQPNGIVGLEAALLVVADPAEAAARFGRFLDRSASGTGDGRFVLALDRGALAFASADWADAHLGRPLPAEPPVIAAVALGVAAAPTTAERLGIGASGVRPLPSALGGAVTLVAPGTLPDWARLGPPRREAEPFVRRDGHEDGSGDPLGDGGGRLVQGLDDDVD